MMSPPYPISFTLAPFYPIRQLRSIINRRANLSDQREVSHVYGKDKTNEQKKQQENPGKLTDAAII